MERRWPEWDVGAKESKEFMISLWNLETGMKAQSLPFERKQEWTSSSIQVWRLVADYSMRKLKWPEELRFVVRVSCVGRF